MTAYATIDDVLALFETAPTSGRQDDRLTPLLDKVSREVEGELGGLDYFRHPTSGSTTWLVDGDGTRHLHLHDGVIALELVEISLDFGRTFVEVPAEDWAYQWAFGSSKAAPEGEPNFHLRMLPLGTYSSFPCGEATVRLTGAGGWPAIPPPLIEGVTERVRQIAYADPSYSGSIPSDDAYGAPTVPVRWPDVTWHFIQRERQRFLGCDL